MSILHELQRVADLYALGAASIQQVMRVAAVDHATETALRNQVNSLAKRLSESNEQNKALRLRNSCLLEHLQRLAEPQDIGIPLSSDAPSAVAVHAAVSRVTGASVEALRGRARPAALARARCLGWLACRRVWPEVSLPEMGRMFGRDHTTILHSLRRGAERMKTDPEFVSDFQAVVNQLADNPGREAAE